ncbi:MAG: SWIM zinc finger family protein [Gammaproteobacteria bacterium]|nr:SWIM zinc finger family protein [Gammaproteobacteria bacterium]
MSLSTEQILALAPDSSSAKAGSELAKVTSWSELGCTPSALWGFCKGSGKNPYKTQIDLSEPAFKCSCPSRKFPCKHGLALYLVYAENAALFDPATPPDWVETWLDSRQQRAEKRHETQEAKQEALLSLTPEERAKKDKSQQKRQEKRESLVNGGVELIELWLNDIAREGINTLKNKPLKEWNELAARMVDAQATGLGARIKKMSSLVHDTNKNDWEMQIATELAKLSLLTQSYRTIQNLDIDLQADIRSEIGWTIQQEDVCKGEAILDQWYVLAHYKQQEDKLTTRYTYLYGQKTNRLGLLLHFAAGNQPLPVAMTVGSYRQGTAYFYPSATPLRVVFNTDPDVDNPIESSNSLELSSTIKQDIPIILDSYANILAKNPFIDEYPFLLRYVMVVSHANKWMIVSPDGVYALRMTPTFKNKWMLLGITGGQPVDIFGLWNGESFTPLSVQTHGSNYNLEG